METGVIGENDYYYLYTTEVKRFWCKICKWPQNSNERPRKIKCVLSHHELKVHTGPDQKKKKRKERQITVCNYPSIWWDQLFAHNDHHHIWGTKTYSWRPQNNSSALMPFMNMFNALFFPSRSSLWQTVSSQDREICHFVADNGEFWSAHLVKWQKAQSNITFQYEYGIPHSRPAGSFISKFNSFFNRMSMEDFCRYYADLDICGQSPDFLDENSSGDWRTSTYEGRWVAGTTAGGCLNNKGVQNIK